MAGVRRRIPHHEVEVPPAAVDVGDDASILILNSRRMGKDLENAAGQNLVSRPANASVAYRAAALPLTIAPRPTRHHGIAGSEQRNG